MTQVLSEISNPKLRPWFLPHFLSDLSHIFRDGSFSLKIFQGQPKFPLNLVPVSHNKRGNLGSEVPEIHILTEFMVRSGCNRFLDQKCKIDAVFDRLITRSRISKTTRANSPPKILRRSTAISMYVCLSVSVHERVSGSTRPIFKTFVQNDSIHRVVGLRISCFHESSPTPTGNCNFAKYLSI